MRTLILSIAAATALAATVAAPPLAAQARSDQGEARKEMQAGNTLPLREIERRVLPTMQGAEYLGPAYDSTAMAYRLKFIRNGRMIWVDVDARSARILRYSR